jgi:predicted nucleic acid-binding protein
VGQKIYLDTNLYIAFFEGVVDVSEKVEKLILDSIENETFIIASPLIITELLVAPLREDETELSDVYKNLKNYIRNMAFVDFSVKISEIAARLRAKYDLATPDCIHLATAIEGGAKIFYTSDKRLKKVNEIKVELI